MPATALSPWPVVLAFLVTRKPSELVDRIIGLVWYIASRGSQGRIETAIREVCHDASQDSSAGDIPDIMTVVFAPRDGNKQGA